VAIGRFDDRWAGRGLTEVLQEDHRLEVLATDLDRAALELAVARHAPCVAIVDEAAARQVVPRLRSLQPATAILVLAHNPTERHGMYLLAAGATCLDRSASERDLLAAVQLAASGERIFATADGTRIERLYPADAPSLTPCELAVFRLFSAGKTLAETAHALKITVRTASFHSDNIREKARVQHKSDLVGMQLPASHAVR